ncbi:MAG: glycosyltransferase family 39 protein [Pseudomonadota bacterium]
MSAWYARRIPLPLHDWPLAALVAAFLLPGLVGHDPWKTEDAIGIGVVHQMLSTGNWLTPTLAGEPFLQDGPVYFWVAAVFVRLLDFVLPTHEAARFASTFFVLLALWWIRLAARELYGRTEGDLSMLALLGCLGLMWHAHETAPDMAMIAGLAGAYYGIAITQRAPLRGGVFYGLGCGLAFLAKGLFGVAQPLLAALLVLLCSTAYRRREFGFAVATGLAVLAPFAAIWPFLLHSEAPAYYQAWWAWQIQNITSAPRWEYILDTAKTLSWAAWPAWPLTLWATWAYRHRLREPGYAVPFMAGLVSLVMLMFVESPDEMDTLVMLVPLAIPAGSAAVRLGRGAVNALAWFAIMTFTLIGAFMWLMWFAALTGIPAKLAANAHRLQPGWEMSVHPVALIGALALTAGWLILVFRSERSNLRALTHWAAGATLCWGLAATLWLDWIDHGRSYRSVAESLRAQLPEHYGCIESRGLRLPQRGLFDYHAGLETRRREVHGTTDCAYLLVQTSTRERAAHPGPEWVQVWEGSRPRDRERYRLYRRQG